MQARKPGGFTLIELMVTVAIIGLLATIAIPQYSDYVRRGNLPQIFSRLADSRIRLEQFYQSNRNYGIGTCGNDGTSATIDFGSGSQQFTLSCKLNGVSPNVDQGYLLTADGSGRMAGHTYTLDSNNSKRTTNFKGAASSSPCWLAKGDEC